MNFALTLEGILIILSIFCWVCIVLKIGVRSQGETLSVLGCDSKTFMRTMAIAIFGILLLPVICQLVLLVLRPDWPKIDRAIIACISGELLFLPIVYKMYNMFKPKFSVSNNTFFDKIFAGMYYFLLALPIVYVMACVWCLVLVFLHTCGLNLSMEQQDIFQLFQTKSFALKSILTLAAVVIAPIVEEIVFRCIMYRFFKAKSSTCVAIFFSSIIFAMFHFNLIAFVPILTLGIFLARAYEASGSIISPIVTHMLFNFNTVVLLLTCGTLV